MMANALGRSHEIPHASPVKAQLPAPQPPHPIQYPGYSQSVRLFLSRHELFPSPYKPTSCAPAHSYPRRKIGGLSPIPQPRLPLIPKPHLIELHHEIVYVFYVFRADMIKFNYSNQHKWMEGCS
jgi:hypothetical protein